jgi:hypothetical protein
LKDHIEGGKAFLNRCDDMFVIHRLIKHETMKFITWVGVEKVKDTETGGKHTALNEPVYCNFNSGIGFEINGVDPLAPHRPKEVQKHIDELMNTSEKLRRLANQNPF